MFAFSPFNGYSKHVKPTLTTLCLLVGFFGGLISCGKQIEGEVFPIPSDPDAERRLVAEEDYLVDYSKGGSNDFFLANGYKNGNPFNCYWSKDAGKIEDGKLKLNLYKENGRYFGAEYRSRLNNFSYGYYATRMKASSCPGVVSSFFTYSYYPTWDEIDIEFLGRDLSIVQFNYYTGGVGGHEYVHRLGFNASEDFHEYGFEWLEDSITWYVDGFKIYRVTKNIPSHPQHLMMNLWNCIGHDDWSGKFDESKLPTQSQYEFIAYIPANR